MEECRTKTPKRIFIGFSSIDRHEIVESILHHLANYGISIWYDRYKMRLGDFYYENFSDGILNSRYAVLLLSHNIADAKCFSEEMKYVKRQFDKGLITVFPILYKIHPDELPKQYEWVTNLVYKEINDQSGVLLICNHIMSRFMTDELKNLRYKTIYDMIYNIGRNKNDSFIEKILSSYLEIDRDNYNARVALLYSLYCYMNTTYRIDETYPKHYWRCFERSFSFTKLHLNLDVREILILELSAMVLINKLFFEVQL